MRVDVVDPSAFTPPYDHALCAALARAGAQVRLQTSRFAYGPVPAPAGYQRVERFYRRGSRGAAGSRARFAAKLAQHVPDMLAYRRAVAAADPPDVVHFQWLTVQPVDVHLLPRARPLAALGVDPRKVHVIAHGAFEHLTRVAGERPLPPALAAVEKPVVLFFGLLRPYKGIDVLLDAWRDVDADAELWIVGMPRMDIAPLRAAAPPAVRWVARFVADDEIAAYFRRADLVVLPYREIDQSGVLFSALAFGVPLVLSAVGGFPELAGDGAAALVAPGDRAALARELQRLLADDQARARLARGARAAAAGRYSWDATATAHLRLYRALTAA